uniref:Uncharacterized protein n=1 Tax=viral metagenome TaxID=1070528 RepID=A0A6C0EFG5_9ZZZZ
MDLKRISTTDLLTYIAKNYAKINSGDMIDLPKEQSSESSGASKISVKSTSSNKKNKNLEFGDVDRLVTLPEKLNKIFGNFLKDFLHMGVYSSNNDTTFFTSIFYCLNSTLSTSDKKTQKVFMDNFYQHLKKAFLFGDYTKFKYSKLKWNKQEIAKHIEDKLPTKYLMRYISDFLHINIFILDLQDDELYFTNSFFVPYKRNIFLVRHFDKYEPLFTEQKKFFGVDDDIIQNIIKHKDKVAMLQLDPKSDEKFEVTQENLELYIDVNQFETKVEEQKETHSEKNAFEDESSESDIEEVVDIEESDDETPDYNKMTLPELKKIAKEKKIPIGKKNKTQLIKELMKE